MLILKSNAQQVFWLGRYLARIECLCQHFPFQSDDMAQRFAQAFLLEAQDAESLNTLLKDDQHNSSFIQLYHSAKNNVHDLRGVLTAQSFSQLNQLLQQATVEPIPYRKLSSLCMQILETEPLQGLQVFYKLGIALEQLDTDIRFQQRCKDLLLQMKSCLKIVAELGQPHIEQSLLQLERHPNAHHFYQLSDQINSIFALDNQ